MVEYINDEKTVVLSDNGDFLFMHCRDIHDNVSILEFSIDEIHNALVVLGYSNRRFPNDLDSIDPNRSSFALAITNGYGRVRYDPNFEDYKWDRLRPELHYVATRLFSEIYSFDRKNIAIKLLPVIIQKRMNYHKDTRMTRFVSIVNRVHHFGTMIEFYSLKNKLRRNWKTKP